MRSDPLFMGGGGGGGGGGLIFCATTTRVSSPVAHFRMSGGYFSFGVSYTR